MEMAMYKSITILANEEGLTEMEYNKLAKKLQLLSFQTLKFIFGSKTFSELVNVVKNREYEIKEIV